MIPIRRSGDSLKLIQPNRIPTTVVGTEGHVAAISYENHSILQQPFDVHISRRGNCNFNQSSTTLPNSQPHSQTASVHSACVESRASVSVDGALSTVVIIDVRCNRKEYTDSSVAEKQYDERTRFCKCEKLCKNELVNLRNFHFSQQALLTNNGKLKREAL